VAPDARSVAAVVEGAHRRHWSAVLASTVRLTRDIDLAEDCTQEAFVRALRTWPGAVPDNPAAWLTTVARREALDRLRRETTLRRKLPLLAVEVERSTPAVPGEEAADAPADLLRLVFTCCHPALAPESRVALTLRLMCGLTTAEVAGCLLIKESGSMPCSPWSISSIRRDTRPAGRTFDVRTSRVGRSTWPGCWSC
jgi:RNA polymerase sigma-70 factor (ECF subfamily)